MDEMTLEKKILSTNDWGLLALLHEGLINNFEKCEKAIKRKDYSELNKLINNSREILTELIVIFNKNEDLSTDLREIYSFTNKLMTRGQIKKDKTCFQEAREVINPILEGFKELEISEDANIVSGLTYGKEKLDEYSRSSGKSFEV